MASVLNAHSCFLSKVNVQVIPQRQWPLQQFMPAQTYSYAFKEHLWLMTHTYSNDVDFLLLPCTLRMHMMSFRAPLQWVSWKQHCLQDTSARKGCSPLSADHGQDTAQGLGVQMSKDLHHEVCGQRGDAGGADLIWVGLLQPKRQRLSLPCASQAVKAVLLAADLPLSQGASCGGRPSGPCMHHNGLSRVGLALPYHYHLAGQLQAWH